MITSLGCVVFVQIISFLLITSGDGIGLRQSTGMSDEGLANTIRNILAQCNSTTIKIAKTEGHFISEKQLAVLEEVADSLEGGVTISGLDTPESSISVPVSTGTDTLQAKLEALSSEIKALQIRAASAEATERVEINLELGQLLSKKAKLDKLVRQLHAVRIS